MIDCHAHLTDDRYQGVFSEIRSGYLASGVNLVVDAGYSINTSILAKDNAEKYSEVYFTAGCHPDDANNVDKTAVLKLEELARHQKCLAIGETGLDYHYLNYDKQTQKQAFISQLELAVKLNKPIVIHSREACKDTVDILKEYHKHLNGFLMHCFSESKETAEILTSLGGYFSFGGVITFKNAKKEEILKSIPQSRILLETDCPYMSPVPYRGSLNKPEYIVKVYERLSDILDIDVDNLKGVIKANFKKLFM